MAKTQITFQGFPITLEYRKGEYREGKSPDGKPWRRQLHAHYGYIKGTTGLDDEEADVYLGTDKDAEQVYAITQMKAPDFDEVDEQKFMLGFADEESAKACYLKHYPDPKILGECKALALDDFKEKVMATSETAKKVAARLVELGLGMSARGEKRAGLFGDITIGALIGNTAGRATGFALGKDVNQSADYGLVAGGVVGALNQDRARLGRTAFDLASGAAQGHLLESAGRAALDYAPELIGGGVGALFANDRLPKTAAQRIDYIFPSYHDSTEDEKRKFAGILSRAMGRGRGAARGASLPSPKAPPVPKPNPPANTVVAGGGAAKPPATPPIPKVNKDANVGATTIRGGDPVRKPGIITPGRVASAAVVGTGALALGAGYQGINAASNLVAAHGGGAGHAYDAPVITGQGRAF